MSNRNAHCKVFRNKPKSVHSTRMCKYCNKQIWWKNTNGKWKPLNNDDTSHICNQEGNKL
jgi:hypothetical protein